MAIGFGYLIFVIAAFMASIYYLIWLNIWIIGLVNRVNIQCFQSLLKSLFTNNRKPNKYFWIKWDEIFSFSKTWPVWNKE
jgi:hypothetical protein